MLARVLLWGHSHLETFLPWVLKHGILPELDMVAWCASRISSQHGVVSGLESQAFASLGEAYPVRLAVGN